MVFQIMPKYKLRKAGQNIQFKDQVLFKNMLLNTYINFCSQDLYMDDSDDEDQKKSEYPEPLLKSLDTQSKRYQANLCNQE